MELYKPNQDFDFSLLTLESPKSIQGGTHFTKINMEQDKPLYIQMPKCVTKQGIVKTNRGMYTDLLYNKNNSETLIDWLLALESHCQKKINEKKLLWFVNEITEDDIENMMTPVYRLYRSGKNLLIRAFVDVDRSSEQPKCMFYDEKEIKLESSQVADNNIIPLLLVEGIKFTSKSFDIEIKLIQAMILNKEPELMQTCLIKKDSVVHNTITSEEAPQTEEPAAPPQTEEAAAPPQPEEPAAPPQPEEPAAPPQPEEPAAPPQPEEAAASPQPEEAAALPQPEEPLQESEKVTPTDETPMVNSILDYVPEEQDYLEKINNDLEEVNIEPDENGTVSIKQPNEIYTEIYRAARAKGKLMRKAAIEAFLEAKKIKTQHLLDDLDSSDDDEDYSSEDELASF